MKKQDFVFCAVFGVLFLPFILSSTCYEWFEGTTSNHPYLMAMVKFGILSTLGEMLGLRIKSGHYSEPGFGIVPRAIVWALLGVCIASAMKIFAGGVPIFLQTCGLDGMVESMKGGFSGQKLFGAFAISVCMNTIFAPIFMTVHKVSDTRILKAGGSMMQLMRNMRGPSDIGAELQSLNWKVQWGFVFRLTIPLFWYPAHTITFMLPPNLQVLFAALLGVALGVILSIAAVRSREA